MTQHFLIFLAGVAGSFHCIGMCGGFACALGLHAGGRRVTLLRHLIYNTGRVTTYCFLGGLAGFLGAALINQDSGTLGLAQRSLAVLSGLLMMFIGLQFFGYFQRISRRLTGYGGESLVRALRALLKAPGAGVPLAFGVLNGFLPCPLVYAFAAQAAASGGPLPGMLTMAAFGLGTFPAMLLMGGIGMWWRPASRKPSIGTTTVSFSNGGATTLGVRPDWRRQGVRIAGGFIIVLGVITFARGVLSLAVHQHPL